MKSVKKKLVILIIIGFVFPLFINTVSDLSFEEKSSLPSPKSSGGYNESFIHIIGTNWTNTLAKPWCYDDSGVYIIENVTIDASSSPTGSAILIENSNVNFIIRNCTLYNAGTGPRNAGIMLGNVNNGIIYNNTCSNNGRYGMMLYWGSDNNSIFENVLKNNQGSGIYFSQNCINNKITNNLFKNNTVTGLYLWNSCENNTITGNFAYENDKGIWLHENSNFNALSNNTIKSNNYGIYIQDSDNNTITKNVAIENLLGGIYLSGSESNNITENTAEDNYRHGILLKSSAKWNNIASNTINDNTVTGIYLQATSDNNIIKNNTINRNDLGILLSSSNYNNVSDNNLKDNNWCIFEVDCTGNDLSENNECTPTTLQEPIFIDGIATGVGAHNWTWAVNQGLCTGLGTKTVPYTIENLKISGFGIMKGIEILNSDVYFTIQHCEIYNSYSAGIYFDNVSNSQLIENECSNNLDNGISLYDKCDFNKITGNVANDNYNDGILIGDKCDNNTISLNIVSSNDDAGIYLDASSLASSYNNTVSKNTVNNNEYGIRLKGAFHFNNISGNTIKNNNFGIKLEESACSNNTLYSNLFIENGKHGIDDGTDNQWNSTTIGNYWDNHTGPDTTPQDGIVDTQYNISGSAGSKDYLPIAEDGPPQITTNSPNNDDLFGSNSPSYNLTIIDDYLFEMWYTFDGGLHNYTFTEFTGTTEQTAWDALSEETNTLTFYASDLLGNIGSAEAIIEKDTQAPIITINSPDPGEIFGNNAPFFNVTITDPNLDLVWLELNGLIIELTIPTSGTVNQAIWAALPEGDYTIYFHANDTLGHSTSEAVSITKTVPSEGGIGLDYLMTSFLIIIMGGLGVLMVLLRIYSKKRLIS